MPLLRYRTGDICAYYSEPCKCGKNSFRISPVRVRKHLKYRGTTLYPQQIFNVLNSMKEIDDFVVELFTNSLGTDEIVLHIALKNKTAENKIKEKLQAALRIIPEIKPIAEIQNMQIIEGKRKIMKLVDRR